MEVAKETEMGRKWRWEGDRDSWGKMEIKDCSTE